MSLTKQPVMLTVNGAPVEVSAGLHDTLLTVLRDQLQCTAAKRGCNQGVCGACTVMVDGRTARACLSLAQNCGANVIRTLTKLRAKHAESPSCTIGIDGKRCG